MAEEPAHSAKLPSTKENIDIKILIFLNKYYYVLTKCCFDLLTTINLPSHHLYP